MPGSSRWPRTGTAEQLRILEKAPTLPCPAHERSGCSWLVHRLLPTFSPGNPLLFGQRNFGGEVDAESGLLLQHQVSEASQSLSFLGPGEGLGLCQPEGLPSTPTLESARASCCRFGGGRCVLSHPDNVLAFESHRSRC